MIIYLPNLEAEQALCMRKTLAWPRYVCFERVLFVWVFLSWKPENTSTPNLINYWEKKTSERGPNNRICQNSNYYQHKTEEI